ncbi:MAG: hypothetical protein DCC75_01635 [Proteobacteria bacterium]|nr:MAG: hypothetical protein DCC75_01635 [Pseudomonadota bacterium]
MAKRTKKRGAKIVPISNPDSSAASARTDIITPSQAETKLTEILDKIRAHERFERCKSKRLEEFWDPAWPSAPFEQQLTVKQVSEMKVSNLLKKRSLSAAKVTAFMESLERAYQFIERQSLAPDSREAASAGGAIPAETFKSRWNEDLGQSNSTLHALFRYIELQCALAGLSPKPFSKFISTIPRSLSAQDFLAAFYSLDTKPDKLSGILGCSQSELGDRQTRVFKFLAETIPKACPELWLQWQMILNGPGVQVVALLAPYSDPNLDGSFQNTIVCMILSAIEAKHPLINGKRHDELWTNNGDFC